MTEDQFFALWYPVGIACIIFTHWAFYYERWSEVKSAYWTKFPVITGKTIIGYLFWGAMGWIAVFPALFMLIMLIGDFLHHLYEKHISSRFNGIVWDPNKVIDKDP